MLQNWAVNLMLGHNALVVETDPSRIAGRIFDRELHQYWTKLNNRAIPRFTKTALHGLKHQARGFDLSDERLFHRVPFERSETYQRMKDVWEHMNNLERSATYRHIKDSLISKGEYRHKNYRISHETEIVSMMRTCYCNMLNSMAEAGYVPGKKSSFATGGTGRAIVWREGTIWHERGATHRLVSARVVGLNNGFPLRIVAAHRDWLHAHGIHSLSEISKLPRSLLAVDGILSVPAKRRRWA